MDSSKQSKHKKHKHRSSRKNKKAAVDDGGDEDTFSLNVRPPAPLQQQDSSSNAGNTASMDLSLAPAVSLSSHQVSSRWQRTSMDSAMNSSGSRCQIQNVSANSTLGMSSKAQSEKSNSMTKLGTKNTSSSSMDLSLAPGVSTYNMPRPRQQHADDRQTSGGSSVGTKKERRRHSDKSSSRSKYGNSSSDLSLAPAVSNHLSRPQQQQRDRQQSGSTLASGRSYSEKSTLTKFGSESMDLSLAPAVSNHLSRPQQQRDRQQSGSTSASGRSYSEKSAMSKFGNESVDLSLAPAVSNHLSRPQQQRVRQESGSTLASGRSYSEKSAMSKFGNASMDLSLAPAVSNHRQVSELSFASSKALSLTSITDANNRLYSSQRSSNRFQQSLGSSIGTFNSDGLVLAATFDVHDRLGSQPQPQQPPLAPTQSQETVPGAVAVTPTNSTPTPPSRRYDSTIRGPSAPEPRRMASILQVPAVSWLIGSRPQRYLPERDDGGTGPQDPNSVDEASWKRFRKKWIAILVGLICLVVAVFVATLLSRRYNNATDEPVLGTIMNGDPTVAPSTPPTSEASMVPTGLPTITAAPTSLSEGQLQIACDWMGVPDLASCQSKIELKTLPNSVGSTIPTELGLLTGLTALILSDAELTGTIPSSLASLTELKEISFIRNALSGTIPASLGSLLKLTSLRVDRNFIEGSIPSELGLLTRLSMLGLSNNTLTGSIPSVPFENLKWLIKLYLHDNELSGSIPSELGSLTRLTELSFSYNALNSTIPETFGKLILLFDLAFSENSLTGTIPSSLASLTKLEMLLLDKNLLTGSVPTSFERLSSLNFLWLDGNDLTGDVPSPLCSFVALEPQIDCSKIACSCCTGENGRTC